ncbi:MAG: hypothetical protein H7343_15750 [Undibacterium sp.]|nr:hypothetical protein [Opitutaceae bacterium]
MKIVYDLSTASWTLTGYNPNYHLIEGSWEFPDPIIRFTEPVPAAVPGSVQGALKAAGVIPDWNIGRNALQAEWVENRDWSFMTKIPQAWCREGATAVLHCDGLDFIGVIKLDGEIVGAFSDGNLPHRFDLGEHLDAARDHILEIVFQAENLPRWLGQVGHTPQIRAQKTRFNYTWDWCPRLVQIGIWDRVRLEIVHGPRIEHFTCYATIASGADTGTIHFRGGIVGKESTNLRLRLKAEKTVVAEKSISGDALGPTFQIWSGFPVERWWPNRSGSPQRYSVGGGLFNKQGNLVDEFTKTVGFRSIEWRDCDGASPDADPWICVVNGTPIFLWGVNWVPTLPNYADESQERVRALLARYRDMGCNIVRLNGCGVLGKECFYDMCDEYGLMVWQDFTLSSSYIDNSPPDEPEVIRALVWQAESIIARRQHHPSLLLWCGGNELYKNRRDDRGRPKSVPATCADPMLRALQAAVERDDPSRRFLATTASGPLATAGLEELGTGKAWDVHGPWSIVGDAPTTRAYWESDDALFRSEVGFQGASSAELILRYAGDLAPLPVAKTNALYKTSAWWVDSQHFEAERGRPPQTIEEYVLWSQNRQAEWLLLAVESTRRRFPRCGGLLLWMGHDCFPCPINTSVIDFEGNPKKAAISLTTLMNRVTPDEIVGAEWTEAVGV